MPILSNPTLKIELNSTDNSRRNITATVKVTFSDGEKAAMQALGGRYRLRCKIWGKDEGEDSGLNGSNDELDIPITGQWADKTETHTFFATPLTSKLDEDDQFQDEIIARFSCVPQASLVLGNATSVNSPKVSGSF